MQLISVVTGVFQNPPIPYEPAKHSLKAWATYCLRDRGFKVVPAQEADFAIEGRRGEKSYFKVTEEEANVSPGKWGWIVVNRETGEATVLPPSPESSL